MSENDRRRAIVTAAAADIIRRKGEQTPLPRWVTDAYSEKLFVGNPTRDEVFSIINVLVEQIRDLTTRVNTVETHGVHYCGVYQRAIGYARGHLVTFDGSMFAALREIVPGEQPGKSDGWQLAVKRGADAQ